MLANLLKFASATCLCGTYYYIAEHNRISLTNPYLSRLIKRINDYQPQYAQSVFKAFLKMKLIERNSQLQGYIFRAGFDLDGNYIDQIKQLGFKGIEVGPTSFNASLQEDPQFHLGINNAMANILTHVSKVGQTAFFIELNIAPNYEVLKYTPYLIKENLVQSLEKYFDVQNSSQQNLVSAVNIDLQKSSPSIQLQTVPEITSMLTEVKAEMSKMLKQFNQNRKNKIVLRFQKQKQLYIDWKNLLAYMQGESL